jgi:hypothetical protein
MVFVHLQYLQYSTVHLVQYTHTVHTVLYSTVQYMHACLLLYKILNRGYPSMEYPSRTWPFNAGVGCTKHCGTCLRMRESEFQNQGDPPSRPATATGNWNLLFDEMFDADAIRLAPSRSSTPWPIPRSKIRLRIQDQLHVYNMGQRVAIH